jgi:hypothetical protein
MRFKGKIAEWNDDRGLGFIRRSRQSIHAGRQQQRERPGGRCGSTPRCSADRRAARSHPGRSDLATRSG